MQREGIAFAEVDIEHDAQAAELVMQANGGNRTVPTLVFADGIALTNPTHRPGQGPAGLGSSRREHRDPRSPALDRA